jgi:hypothetical protein
MKAVLVGTHEGNRVYYDFDAHAGSRDGIIVREDGSTVKIYLISWSAKVKGLNQIRNTSFHRFFWDAPKIPTKGKWFEMFIKKSIKIDKEVLGKLNIETSLGQTKKKLQKKNSQAIKFMNYKTSGEMVDYKVSIPHGSKESSNDNV